MNGFAAKHYDALVDTITSGAYSWRLAKDDCVRRIRNEATI